MGLKASKLAASHVVVGFDENGNEADLRGQLREWCSARRQRRRTLGLIAVGVCFPAATTGRLDLYHHGFTESFHRPGDHAMNRARRVRPSQTPRRTATTATALLIPARAAEATWGAMKLTTATVKPTTRTVVFSVPRSRMD
jgi:hypothetical protein